MERLCVLFQNSPIGSLQAEGEGLYTRFFADCALPEEEGVWCVWVIAERGEVRLGVMEPQGEHLLLSRRLSRRTLDTIGTFTGAELRRLGEEREQWKAAETILPKWLAPYLQSAEGVLTAQGEGWHTLAIPYAKDRPFPVPRLFCFGRLSTLKGQAYILYRFSPAGWPLFF